MDKSFIESNLRKKYTTEIKEEFDLTDFK